MQKTEDGNFVVLGLSDRVRNDTPAAIGALWERFWSEDLRARIGPEAGRAIHCVYHEYEGDFSAPYRMTIGYRVPAALPTPEGLHRAEVPGQVYAVFPVEGPQPQTLIAQWQAIWGGDLRRNYRADFDLYDADHPGRITVHVGVAAP